MPTPNDMPGAQQPAASTPAPGATPAATPPAADAGATPAASPAASPDAGQQPPWGSEEDFDPNRAWKLIQELRGDKSSMQQRLNDAQPILDEHERLRLASLDDNQRLTEQLGQANSRGDTWRTRAVTSAVEAAAAGRFNDPKLVLAAIGDVSAFVDGDDIDPAKIAAALDKVATDHPVLVAQQQPTGPKGFAPDPSQGQSGAGSETAFDAQIKAAQDRGDHLTVIGLRQQRAAAMAAQTR